MATGDYVTVQSIGRDSQGIAWAFGFDGMSYIGHSLGQAANDGAPGEIQRLAEELASYIDRLRIVDE